MESDDIITVANKTYDLSQLPENERIRLRHLKMHEEHRGHEAMHLEMFLITIVGIALSQALLMVWRDKYFKSYQLTTLAALILVPPLIGVVSQAYRFVVVCVIFYAATAYVVRQATRPVILPGTPRFVYGWFLLVHNVTYTIGLAGYIILFVMFLSGGFEPLVMLGFYLLMYGIYFGVVGRDFAEVCSDKMASKIGYYAPNGLTLRNLDQNTCSICTQPLLSAEGDDELFQLNCSHSFHEKCIRGWCIVGKKDTCPYCKEKVDLRNTFTNPWMRPHVLYGNYLDFIRYMVAWQPIVLFIITHVNKYLGLK